MCFPTGTVVTELRSQVRGRQLTFPFCTFVLFDIFAEGLHMLESELVPRDDEDLCVLAETFFAGSEAGFCWWWLSVVSVFPTDIENVYVTQCS